MEGIFKKVLARIKPSKEEELVVKGIAEEVISKIKIKDANPILGGSGAKGTWITGTHDIDIYVRFNKEVYKNKDISSILEKELKKRFEKFEKLHGSRDYFQIPKDGYTIEVVPILDIKKASEALNITDVSPLHTEWVRKHSSLSDDIRLAKSFCRAQGCYGAESYIRGFSGYVAEILVINYGSFQKFIGAVSNWRQKEFIDIEKHGVELNKAKTNSPLIVIDPVQSDRNAAAALSKEKYDLLIKSAKAYLKSPSEDFFIKKEITKESLKAKSKDSKLIMFDVVPLKGKEDVVGAKILKAYTYILNSFVKEGFIVNESSWSWNSKALLYYTLDANPLPEFKVHQGPKVNQLNHVLSFKRKNKKYEIFEKQGRLFCKIPHKFRDATIFSKNILKDEGLKSLVKSIKLSS